MVVRTGQDRRETYLPSGGLETSFLRTLFTGLGALWLGSGGEFSGRGAGGF